MPIQFGGPGVNPSLGNLVTNQVDLQSGECWVIPAGRWNIKSGRYTSVQQYDSILGIWKNIGAGGVAAPIEAVFSDGVNYRLANQTGAPVGAVVTAGGTGYNPAAPPLFTPSAGGSIWRAIVGGAVATAVAISNGGVNYVYPPTVLFSSPPPGGVPAAGYATLTNGAVSAITVTDQGAGYNTPPTVTFVNDPREGQNGLGSGTGAAAVPTLTGAGTVTALVCVDHGQGGQTAVPTLTVSSGAATAVAIMCWSITAYAVSTTTAGSGYAAPVVISAYDTPPGGSALLNPAIQANLVKTREARLIGALSGAALTATGQTVKDGGIYTAAPTVYAYGFIQGASAVAAVLSATMGGQLDSSYVSQT